MRNAFRSIAVSMLLITTRTAFGADGSDMATPSDAKIMPKSPELQATVYGRVLAMKPGNPDAIEQRGHAFLALDRLSEAKEAYLTLFPTHRKPAATLLAGMEAWVAEHRLDPVGVDSAMVETFASWVSERKAMAGHPARAANYHQATE